MPTYAGQNSNISKTNEPRNTAAQDALAAVEELKARLDNLRGHVERLAERVGEGLPPGPATDTAPRAVRSGIIGAIHTTAEHAHDIADACHALMNRIEQQV